MKRKNPRKIRKRLEGKAKHEIKTKRTRKRQKERK